VLREAIGTDEVTKLMGRGVAMTQDWALKYALSIDVHSRAADARCPCGHSFEGASAVRNAEELKISASIGVACFPVDTESPGAPARPTSFSASDYDQGTHIFVSH
jgi:hypothetical protein